MGSDVVNPLLSTSKSSDSQIQVQLHPLVILTISDYVTRHTLRQQTGSVIGAIIGVHNGREITMEHAFECKTEQNENGDVILDNSWFSDRLQQYKDVHKSTALDLVGWFALVPSSGPEPRHLPIHLQLVEQYNESTVLLAFHPDSVVDGASKGGKLPMTIYEASHEANTGDGDKHMKASDVPGPQLAMRFKEIPYTIETEEAEMISMDFVARGGANATVDAGTTSTIASTTTKADIKGKEKVRTKSDALKEEGGTNSDILSQEDEELISSLTAKANAIRMLQQRISLMKAYLKSIPPCYLNTPTSSAQPMQVSQLAQISYPILRTMSSTLARLPLLTPPKDEVMSSSQSTPINTSTFSYQAAQQRSDVALTSLLGSLGSTLRSAQDMGKKASVVERARIAANQQMHLPNIGGGVPSKHGKMPFPFSLGATADRQPIASDFSSTQGDEGYVDDYDENDNEYDGHDGGLSRGSGGGISLSELGSASKKKFTDDDDDDDDDDDEMTD